MDYSLLSMTQQTLEAYEELESEQGLINAVTQSFRIFNSLLRIANNSGIAMSEKLFGAQMKPKRLPESSLLSSCRIYANRSTAEKNHLQHKCKLLEIGVATGSHAASLIQSLNPSTFHGVDMRTNQLSEKYLKILRGHATQGNIVQIYESDSVEFLKEQVSRDQVYDIIYIDANHWHHFVKPELELSSKLISIGGHIVLNDYVKFFPNSMEPCGVIKAVNDFLETNDNWKIEYFAINDNDICIRRID